MDLFAKLETDLTARRDKGALDRALRRWQETREALRCFDDLDLLISSCRDGQAPRRAVDGALSALCRQATFGDQDAVLLLLWLLLPGLLLARARLTQTGVLDAEEVASEMVAGAWEAATRLPASAEGVATRLVNSARWRALDALDDAIDWAGRTTAVGTDVEEEGAHAPPVEPDPLREAVRNGVLTPGEARLVIADHRDLVDLSRELRISLTAGRQRRARARARLRDWLETD